MVIFSKSGAFVVLVALLTLSRYSVSAAATEDPPSRKPGTNGAEVKKEFDKWRALVQRAALKL